MYHNSFDLEVHAKSVRERAMADAANDRRAAEACRSGRDRAARSGLDLPGAAAMIRRWFAPRRIGYDPRPAGLVPAVDFPPTRSTIDRERNPPRRPSRAAEPYGAMLVIARGWSIERADAPSFVEEC